MTEAQILITIVLLAISVWITRFLPFIVFSDAGHLPKIVDYLGKALPAALMGLLVVYCFKDYNFQELSATLPALISVAAVALLQIKKHNTILSITVGTALYMILIRLI